MTLNGWRDEVFRGMERQGFHEDRSNAGRDDTLVRLCLVHTEVSEAAQVVKRHGVTPESRPQLDEELADVFVRLFDLCGCLGVDVDAAVAAKMAANMARPRKYGTPAAGQ
jgi:NTP pyrophosphatase (non-canonical NTP hydrolase)